MRPALAAVLGLALTWILSFGLTLATSAWLAAPDGAPLPIGRTLMSASLAIAFGTSVLGGFASAHARAHRVQVILAVAIGAALSGVLSAMQAPADAPAPIAWSVPVLAFLGALAGGGIRSSTRAPGSTA